jgi:hypothetical protein
MESQDSFSPGASRNLGAWSLFDGIHYGRTSADSVSLGVIEQKSFIERNGTSQRARQIDSDICPLSSFDRSYSAW